MRWLLVCLVVAFAAAGEARDARLARAHSHNDYEQARPLLDALDNEFGSVEADIFLVDGALLVAHDRKDCVPGRTLEALYLAPLAERAQADGGRIYPGTDAGILLLIDIKDDAAATYPVLRAQLQQYSDILTKYTDAAVTPGPVNVVLSGNRPIDLVAAEPERLCGIDGRLPDLVRGVSPQLYPLISDAWPAHFQWRGEGPLPAAEQEKLRGLIAKAHAGGHLLRFWALPNRPETVWPVLEAAGLDLLNTDDLPKLRAFLLRGAGK